MTRIVPNWAVNEVFQSPNFTQGRPGSPNTIFVHHWGADGQRHGGVLGYFLNPRQTRKASAHYIVSAGRITQVVSDSDRAWHAGPNGNPRGIGIECRPEMSDGDFESVATLIAAIWSEHGRLRVRGHKDVMSTACPGRWYARLGALEARAAAILAGGKHAAPTPRAEVPIKVGNPEGYGVIPVDGLWDTITYTRLSRVMGTWGQGLDRTYSEMQAFLNAHVWERDIRNLIGKAALDVDGLWGPDTNVVLAYWLWNNVPGLPECTVWQDFAKGWSMPQFCSRQWGKAQTAVLQECLNRSWADTGLLMGPQPS